MPTPNIPSPEETLHAVLKCKQKKSSNYIAMFAEGLYYMYVIENNEHKSIDRKSYSGSPITLC